MQLAEQIGRYIQITGNTGGVLGYLKSDLPVKVNGSKTRRGA